MTLKIKDPAPNFILPDQHGNSINLSSYQGRWVLVYFYPKDDTPGCTVEACGFRDRFPDFSGKGYAVVGVSPDNVASHKKFAEKFKLAFPLLADEEKSAARSYGVWGKKKFMGKEYMGINRTSFVIDPYGRINKIYEKVRPEGHATEVFEYIQGLDKG